MRRTPHWDGPYLEQIWDIVSLFRDIIGAGQGSQPCRAMDVDLSHVGPSVGGETSVFILVVVSTTTIVEFAPSFTISPTVLEHECSIAVQP